MSAHAMLVDPAMQFQGLTREQYDRLVETGALDDHPVELLEGGIYRMAPQGWPHHRVTSRLRRHLERAWWSSGDERYLVTTHSPVAAGDMSEPEPDLYVYDADADDAGHHPAFAHLVVEVTQSSHARDLVHKPRIYAASGFPEYWVVDLPGREVVVHTDPRPDLGEYGTVRRLPFETELDVLGVTVRLTDLAD